MSYVPISWIDALDVMTVAVVLWALLVWLRRARARLALLGIAILGSLYAGARIAGFELTAWVFQGFFAVLVIVVVVVFQEDLRRLFERIAVWSLRRRTPVPALSIVDALVRTVARMAEARTGALIVVPGVEPLERHVEGGVALDGRISEPLLLSLFDASSPGHDGAVLIRGDRIARFALHLPLSTNQAELGPGGTRHAAALGLAERTDALCIVVSEERGTVSVAREGHLRVLGSPRELLGELQRFKAETTPGGHSGRRLVATSWREALLALAIAGGLWAVRVPGSSVAEIVRPAQVVVVKLPPDLVLEDVDPPVVEVTLAGLRRDLLLGAGETVEVQVDALLAKLGRRTFALAPADVRAPEGLEVVSLEPGQVRISVRPAEAAAP